MKINNKYAITLIIILFVCTVFSCSTKPFDAKFKLNGTWVLDSELYPRGGIQKVTGESHVFKFLDKEHYSYEWWQSDLTNKSFGRYFILENPNRKSITITFIPDLQIFETDTTRMYLNYDIISLSDSTLKIVGASESVKNTNGSNSTFNREYIYKRHK